MDTHKFTPGPWVEEYDEDSDRFYRGSIMDDNLRVEIALVTQDVSFDRDDGEPTVRIARRVAEANARLIAAAPEMLHALREAEDLIEMQVDDSDPDCPIAATFAVVRAAIEKAVGK